METTCTRLAEVLAGRGGAALAAGDAEGAEGPLSRSAELDSRSWMTWNNLGLARSKLGRPAQALDAFQRALGLRPDAYEVLVNAASVHASIREAQRALDLLARATTVDPKKAIAWMFLGNVHRETGDSSKALSAYDHALGCDPKDGRIHFLMAATYASMDPPQKARAEAHLKKARALGYPPEKR
jgi:tetratricopeptide (TPR) repeat protein